MGDVDHLVLYLYYLNQSWNPRCKIQIIISSFLGNVHTIFGFNKCIFKYVDAP